MNFHIAHILRTKTSNYWVWGLFFFVTVAMAVGAQLILSRMFPALHAGHGLLVGGDWVGFHQIAHDMAQKIHAEGWSAWELHPYGHSPAGIAAALYAVFVPEPYILIPLNAAIHAFSGVILMMILFRITGDRPIAFLAALPFVVFPSAATWYAQIHRDGYYILGMLLFCYGWVQTVTGTEYERRWWLPSLALILSVVGGTAFVWLARPYALHLLFAVSLLLALIVMLQIFRGREKHRLFSKKVVVETLSIILVLGGFYTAIKNAWFEDVDLKVRNTSTTQLVVMDTATKKSAVPEKSVTSAVPEKSVTSAVPEKSVTSAVPEKSATSAVPEKSARKNVSWQKSEWLPERVDTMLFSVAASRQSSILTDPGAKSLVDSDIDLYSAGDFVGYFPRALQVAFLAPFPSQWFAAASTAQGGVMRKVAAVEMILVYVSLMWLPFSLWKWRRKPEMWVALLFAVAMLTIYGYVMPNVGTLYRMRYGFFLIIIGIALASALSYALRRGMPATTRSP